MKVTHKHIEMWYISGITDGFLDQRRVNVCEHAIMTSLFEFEILYPQTDYCNTDEISDVEN